MEFSFILGHFPWKDSMHWEICDSLVVIRRENVPTLLMSCYSIPFSCHSCCSSAQFLLPLPFFLFLFNQRSYLDDSWVAPGQVFFFLCCHATVWETVLRKHTGACLKGLKMPWSLWIFPSHFIINRRQPFIYGFMSHGVTSKRGTAHFHPFVLCAVNSAGVHGTTAETSDADTPSGLTRAQNFPWPSYSHHEHIYIVNLRNMPHI